MGANPEFLIQWKVGFLGSSPLVLMQLVWELHLKGHWQREVLLDVNWGSPGFLETLQLEDDPGAYLILLVCKVSYLTHWGSTTGLRDAEHDMWHFYSSYNVLGIILSI